MRSANFETPNDGLPFSSFNLSALSILAQKTEFLKSKKKEEFVWIENRIIEIIGKIVEKDFTVKNSRVWKCGCVD